jgi:predicted transcriptional regulator
MCLLKIFIFLQEKRGENMKDDKKSNPSSDSVEETKENLSSDAVEEAKEKRNQAASTIAGNKNLQEANDNYMDMMKQKPSNSPNTSGNTLSGNTPSSGNVRPAGSTGKPTPNGASSGGMSSGAENKSEAGEKANNTVPTNNPAGTTAPSRRNSSLSGNSPSSWHQAVQNARAQRNRLVASNYGNTNLQHAQSQHMINMRTPGNVPNNGVDVGRVQLKSGAAEKIGKLNTSIGTQSISIARNNMIPKGEAGKGMQYTLIGVTALHTLNPIRAIGVAAQKSQYKMMMNAYVQDTIRNNPKLVSKMERYNAHIEEMANGTRTKVGVKFTDLEKALIKGDYKKVTQLQVREINNVLKANGYRTIPPNLKGKDLERFCHKNLSRIKRSNASVPQDVLNALSKGEKLGKASIYAKSANQSPLKGQIRQLSHMMLRNSGEGGRGLSYCIDITQKTFKLAKMMCKNIHRATGAVRLETQKAMIALLKKKKALQQRQYARNVNKAIKSHQKLLKSKGKNATRQREKFVKSQKKASKLGQKLRNKKPKPKRFSKLRNRVGNWFRKTKLGNALHTGRQKYSVIKGRFSQFSTRRKAFFKKINDKLNNSLVGKAVNKVAGGFAKISQAFAEIKRQIIKLIGTVVVVYVLLYLILLIIQIIAGAFDFANATKKEVVCGYLQNLYQNDLKYMVYCYPGYTIEFDDRRNQDSYDEYTGRSGESSNNSTQGNTTTTTTTQATTQSSDDDDKIWLQSTNCAEILSMMWVNFGYTIKNYSNDVLKEYIEGLYYGSHEISVDEGKKTIKFTTYYFDYLFARQPRDGEKFNDAEKNMCPDNFWQDEMSHSPMSTKGPSLGTLGSVEKQVYDALTKEGFTSEAAVAIMGNIYAESGFDTAIHGSNDAYGLYQFDPGASGSSSSPSPGSAMDGYMKYIEANSKNFSKKDSAAKQTEYVLTMLPGSFQSYTGCSTVYSYGTGNTTDTSMYHVWVMTKYLLDDFKSWNVDTELKDELVKDFTTHGDSGMDGGGAAVTAYLNSLSDKEKSVAYATLLFTRVYEKASTHDWISQRVKKAIEYYHLINGAYNGEARDTEEKGITWEQISSDPNVNKYYSGHGGINPFTDDNGLDKNNGDRGGNCTAYAWGRRAEMENLVSENGTLIGTLLGTNGDAYYWYQREVDAGIYRCGDYGPQVGAVVCWAYGDSTSNGHVAIIEKINEDGSIITSNGKYGSMDGIPEPFYISYYASEADLKAAHNFKGYIYLDRIK